MSNKILAFFSFIGGLAFFGVFLYYEAPNHLKNYLETMRALGTVALVCGFFGLSIILIIKK